MQPNERHGEAKEHLKEMKDVVVPMAVTSWKGQHAALNVMIAAVNELQKALKTSEDKRKFLETSQQC